MAEQKQLVIQLRVDGTVHAETRQIFGEACVPFAALLEDLCDAEAIDSAYTGDYYLKGDTDNAVTQVQNHDHA